MQGDLFNIRTLAKYLNVSRTTIYRLLNNQDLPSYRIGGHLRFKKDDIEQWLADREKENKFSPPVEEIKKQFQSPFVGRRKDLAICEQVANQVLDGRGEFLVIQGPGGIGKSRLLEEASRRYQESMTHWSASCDTFGEVISLHPFGKMLRDLAQVTDEDDADTAREKLRRTFDADACSHLIEWVDHYAGIMHYPLPTNDAHLPAQWKTQSRRALMELFRAFARKSPLCITIEDLHWADPSTWEFLDVLVSQLRTEPILVCLTLSETDSSFRVSQWKNATVIELHTLSPEESELLLYKTVKSEQIIRCFQTGVLEKIDGNPLLLKELSRGLEREGKSEAEAQEFLMKELEEVVEQRVGTLDRSIRLILNLASVAGREFSLSLLELTELAKEALDEKLLLLESSEILKQGTESGKYCFRHPIVQQVVYENLSEDDRQALHGQVFEALKALPSLDEASHSDLLAYHAYQAGRAQDALHYLEKSARSAADRYANREALALYEQVLGILMEERADTQAPAIVEVLLKKASLHRYIGEIEECEEALTGALKIARKMGREELEAQAHISRAIYLTGLGDYSSADEECGLAEAILAERDAPELWIKLETVKAMLSYRQGKAEQAEEAFRSVIAQSEAIGKPFFSTNAYNNLGLLYGEQNRYEEALECHEKALKIRRESGDRWGQVASMNNIGIIHENRGDLKQAEAIYAEGLKLARKTGYYEAETALLVNLGQLAEKSGDYSEALGLAARSLDLARQSGDIRSEGIALENCGNVYIRLGDLDEASEHYEKALVLAERLGDQAARTRINQALNQLEDEPR